MDREAVAREADELQERIASKHEKRLAKAIERAWLAVAADLPTGGRADPPIEHVRQVRTALEELYRDATRRTAAGLVGQFKSGFTWLESKAGEDDFYTRLYEEYLYIYGGSSIAQISETTRRQIADAIKRGLVEGLSLDEVAADLVQRAPEIGELRAAIIARTETHSASMFASTESAKRSTIPLVKEWVSVEDHRTRDFGEGDGIVDAYSHRIMNGVQVPLDQPFEVPMRTGTAEKLMFPGDPSGSAGNVINCRCALVYETADDQQEVEAPTPTQRTPGGAQFLYETMEDPPAKTAALNAFITDNGIADNVDLKGVKAVTIAPHMRHFLEVKERFGLDPMYAVGPASRFLPRGGVTKGALAAIYPVRHRESGRMGIWHMPTKFGNEAEWDKNRMNGLQATLSGRFRDERNRKLEANRYIDEGVRTRVQRMDDDKLEWAWTIDSDNGIGSTTYEYRRSTIYHEFGHVFHLSNTANPNVKQEINDFLYQVNPRASGWGYLVSKYGNSNNNEYVAETFALYMRGDPDQFYRIHPELLAIYQRYDKASAVKGYRLMSLSHKQVDIPGAELLATDGTALINAVIGAAPEDREKLARELLAAYESDDKELVELWLWEAVALTVVDTI